MIQSKPVIPLLNTNKKFSVLITEDFWNQVRFLNSKITTKEYFCVCLFKTEGKPLTNNFTVIPDHLIFMDEGEPAYTKFDWQDKYLLKKIAEKRMHVGIQHSHVRMNTFFSATDDDELRDNAKHFPFYFSIITNLNGNVCAKIAVAAKEHRYTKSIESNVNGVKEFFEIEVPERDVIYTYEGVINFQKENVQVEQEFIDRYESKSKEIQSNKNKYHSFTRPFSNTFANSYKPAKSNSQYIAQAQYKFDFDLHGDNNTAVIKEFFGYDNYVDLEQILLYEEYDSLKHNILEFVSFINDKNLGNNVIEILEEFQSVLEDVVALNATPLAVNLLNEIDNFFGLNEENE